MDLLDFAMVGGVVLGSYVLGIQVMNRALNSSLKKKAVQELFTALGIKSFKPQDLNADKLDETGFARLITLLREVKGPGDIGGMMGQLQQLQGIGQVFGALGTASVAGKVNETGQAIK